MSKHIVVISDGDPTPPSARVISQLVASKITVTAVLTAAHGNDPGAMQRDAEPRHPDQGPVLQRHQPQGPAADLPEGGADDLAPADLRADDPPGRPRSTTRSPSRSWACPTTLPPITGLVLTSPKENELVEIPIVSPLPTGQVNPVLAHWTYGLGRSVAFTSDAGRRWAKAWPDWQSYAAFWSQVVRWSMRPADRGNLTLNVRREEGRIKVVVDALDKDNQFLNFLQIQGNVVNPDLKPSPIELVQTAPGRYEATIENAEASGNYFVNLGYRGPDNVQGVISTGRLGPLLRRVPRAAVEPDHAGDARQPDRRPGRRLEVPARRPGRPAADRRRGRPLPPRPEPDQSRGRSPRSGRPCSGWRPACSWATSPSAGSRPTSTGSSKPSPTNGGSSAARRSPRASEYMEKLRSRKAEVDEQLDRSRCRDPRSRPPPHLCRTRRRPVRSASRCSKGPSPRGRAGAGRARPAEPEPRRPSASRPEARATPTACSRPSSGSGRSGRRTRTRTSRDDRAAPEQDRGFSS